MFLVRRMPIVSVTLLISGILSGCAGMSMDGKAMADFMDRAVSAARPAMAMEAEPTPQPETEPSAEASGISLQRASTADPMSARDIFAQLSPSVAFVETPLSTGSAVLIEQNYLLTNAHVVWPSVTTRLVFPDGAEYENVPVVAWDLIADLALLGPVDHGAPALALTDGAGLEVGSQVYLIGYPGEVERLPQPTLVQGILSRLRNWPLADMAFYQIDASVAGGQSGGALISDTGELLGIVSYLFTDAGFGIAPTAADIVPRVNALLAEGDAGLQERRILDSPSNTVFDGTLQSNLAEDIFLLPGVPNKPVLMTIQGPGTPSIEIYDIFGEFQAESQMQRDGTSSIRFTPDYEEPYGIFVSQFSENPNAYELTASEPIFAVNQPEDGELLKQDQEILGAIDITGDMDWFELELEEGERIAVMAQSLLIDPLLILLYSGETLEEMVVDDDSGEGGIFGLDAEIVYKAPKSGTYLLFISDAESTAVGGYLLTITKAGEDQTLTEPYRSQRVRQTAYGRLAQFDSENTDFRTLYPTFWQTPENAESVCGANSSLCLYNGVDAGLTLLEEDLLSTEFENGNVVAYTDAVLENLETFATGFELQARSDYRTLQGLDAEILTYTFLNDQIAVKRMIFLDDDNHAVNFMIFADADQFSLYEDFIDYLFESVRLRSDQDVVGEDPVWYYDQADQMFGEDNVTGALLMLKRTLDIDPDFAPAYQLRAAVHREAGDSASMINDINRFVELSPDDPEGYAQRALFSWLAGDYAQSLIDTDRLLALDPEAIHAYNLRALNHTAMDDPDAALAALDEARRPDEELPAYMRDTLAYVYLTMGDIDAAQQEYAALLEDDFQSAYTLMGAGIAYIRAGDAETGLPLLARGYAEVAENTTTDPQLDDLRVWAEELLED